jgi:glutaredoxin
MKNFFVILVLFGSLLGLVRGDDNIYGPGGVNLGPNGNPELLNQAIELRQLEKMEATDGSRSGFAEVDLYVTSWCPYCKKAIAFMRENNIPYKAYDIEEDSNAAIRKKALDPDYSGIPLAVIYGKSIRGFDEDAYKQALQMK